MIKVFIGVLGKVLGGWAIDLLLNEKNVKKLILWGANRLVKMTDTPHDDEFLAVIEKALKEADEKKGA